MAQEKISLKNDQAVVIRFLQEPDYSALAGFFEALRSEKNIHIYPNIDRPENIGALIRHNLKHDKALVVVAEGPDAGIVGFASFFTLSGYARLNLLAVDTEWQNLGIGRRLMDYSLKALGDLNIARVGLAVYDNNPNAIRLYQKLGFGITKRRLFWLKLKLLLFSMMGVIGIPGTLLLSCQALLKSLVTRKIKLIEMEKVIQNVY